jgi:predicted nucleic acid-binding protein
MKLFFDSNVWVAAFGTRGLCLDLVEQAITLNENGALSLLVCPAVMEEVQRILTDKFRLAEEEVALATDVLNRIQPVPDGDWVPAKDFPDTDDILIVAAALAAGTRLFVTGDKALLNLGVVEDMPIVNPREAYLRLRGLV